MISFFINRFQLLISSAKRPRRCRLISRFEASTQRAQDLIRGTILIISDFAAAEFSSAVARRVRNTEIRDRDAASVFALLDGWFVNAAKRESILAGDIAMATGLVRRLDLGLHTPDAINIAIAQRCEAQLLTFDERMARSATAIGMVVVTLLGDFVPSNSHPQETANTPHYDRVS